jgi:hypothetical protein
MITILVLGASHAEAAPATTTAAGDPSVELLFAAGAEEALEKLARNRRIDAVLLLPGSRARELAEALAEEDPTAPPLFAPASMKEIPGVQMLHAGKTGELIEAIVEFLEPR